MGSELTRALVIGALPVLATVLFITQLFVSRKGVFFVYGVVLMIVYGAVSVATGRGDLIALLTLCLSVVAGFFELASPGFGIFGATGIVCLLVGILLAAGSTVEGVLTILCVLAVGVITTALYRATGHHVTWLDDKILWTRNGQEEGFLARTSPSESWQGKRGRATTNLRPAGIVDIDGARVDVMTRGEFIAQGQTVEVIERTNGVLIVREVAQVGEGE